MFPTLILHVPLRRKAQHELEWLSPHVVAEFVSCRATAAAVAGGRILTRLFTPACPLEQNQKTTQWDKPKNVAKKLAKGKAPAAAVPAATASGTAKKTARVPIPRAASPPGRGTTAPAAAAERPKRASSGVFLSEEEGRGAAGSYLPAGERRCSSRVLPAGSKCHIYAMQCSALPASPYSSSSSGVPAIATAIDEPWTSGSYLIMFGGYLDVDACGRVELCSIFRDLRERSVLAQCAGAVTTDPAPEKREVRALFLLSPFLKTPERWENFIVFAHIPASLLISACWIKQRRFALASSKASQPRKTLSFWHTLPLIGLF